MKKWLPLFSCLMFVSITSICMGGPEAKDPLNIRHCMQIVRSEEPKSCGGQVLSGCGDIFCHGPIVLAAFWRDRFHENKLDGRSKSKKC